MYINIKIIQRVKVHFLPGTVRNLVYQPIQHAC